MEAPFSRPLSRDCLHRTPASRPALSYQWTFNDVPIQGEDASMLVVRNVTTNQAGNYSVIASNAGGISQSIPVKLTIAETNPVPRLATVPSSAPVLFPFTLTGEGGRWYKIESSSNLTNWVSPSWSQATNETSYFSRPRLLPNLFVRASLHVPTDVCVAQMKQIRAAQFLWAI